MSFSITSYKDDAISDSTQIWTREHVKRVLLKQRFFNKHVKLTSCSSNVSEFGINDLQKIGNHTSMSQLNSFRETSGTTGIRKKSNIIERSGRTNIGGINTAGYQFFVINSSGRYSTCIVVQNYGGYLTRSAGFRLDKLFGFFKFFQMFWKCYDDGCATVGQLVW